MDEYLTTSQVAKKLGTSMRTVQRLISKGVIMAEKVGNLMLIKPSEVAKAVDRPTVGRPRKPGKKPKGN